MPYSRRYKKRSRRPRRKMVRRKKRKRRFGAISYLKLNSPSLLPDQTYVKLKYRERVNLTGTSGNQVYRMNSLFDPNFTGGGSQPLGFDQWKTFYGHYQVLGSAIKIVTLNNSAVPAVMALYPSIDSTTLTFIGEAREQPYAKSSNIGSVTGNGKGFLKSYMAIRKLEGRNTDSVNFTASISTNPSSSRFWHIKMISVDNLTATDLWLDIEITFYTKLFSRISILGS